MTVTTAPRPLFEASDWDFATLERVYDAIAEIALGELGLDIYPNQIEIISSEQMLDAYASVGLPLMYHHWSFGKRRVRDEKLYRKGLAGLAYEIVINSNPCISYNMEENTMAMQTLVMAHAAFGHNHFFKNNYLFRQWTDADNILEYLEYAKKFVAKCEERHGLAAVEETLDAAHALMDQGVFRYRRPPPLTESQAKKREEDRLAHLNRIYNDLWRTVPTKRRKIRVPEVPEDHVERRKRLELPEENILHFIERYSPVLEPWQRELLRLVQYLAQYFYPQKQTKVMNEGCASFVHHYITRRLFEKGLITEGAMLEILHSHTNVVAQFDFDDQRYGGINPYALGFAMMNDIVRICTAPTDEDREWFPDVAGRGDWQAVLREAWANYRDESFIRQFLSPKLIRDFRLFLLLDEAQDTHLTVTDIHDERGYRAVRHALADGYDLATVEPDIQIVDCDLRGSREIKLVHTVRNGVTLDEDSRLKVLRCVRTLWGYEVSLTGKPAGSDETMYETRTG